MQLVSGDILLLILEVLLVNELKRRRPDIFFFAKGVQIFLPPREQSAQEQQPQPSETKKRGKKQHEKTSYLAQYTSAELNQLTQFPLYDEYEKVAMLTAVLVCHIVLKLVLQAMPFLPGFLTETTSLPFFVTVLLLAYAARYGFKVSTHNGYLTYEFKAAMLVTTVLTVLLFSARMVLTDYLPKDLIYAVSSQIKHFNVLLAGLSDKPFDLSTNAVVLVAMVFSGLLTLINIPSIIKYGNSYTQVLQNTYSGEQHSPQQLEEQKTSQLLVAAKLKLQSERQLKIFNVQLVVWTGIVLLWGLPVARQELSETLLYWTLACLLGVATYMNIFNYYHEISDYFFQACDYIKKLQKEDSPTEQLVKTVQRKVYSYIGLFWFPCYQLMLRFIVPVLLFLLLTQKTFLNVQPSSYEDAKYHYAINSPAKQPIRVNVDTSCGLVKDTVLTLKQLYKCPANSDISLETVGINGWQLSLSSASVRSIANKVSTYGLLTKAFEVAFLQEVCWYYFLSRYLLTIFYIIFLRKTVLNI